MECHDSKHREASNSSQFCTEIRWWCPWPCTEGADLGRWEPGAAALPRLLLLSHDALHRPLLALQLPRFRVPLTSPLFLHHFYSGLALLALNGVVDDLLRHRWIMGIHWIIWTRYFVGLSLILLGVLWVRKEDLWCESLF